MPVKNIGGTVSREKRTIWSIVFCPTAGEISVIGTQPEEFAAMIADRLQLELRNN